VVVHVFKHLHGHVFGYSKTGEYVSIYSFGWEEYSAASDTYTRLFKVRWTSIW
jgi:hypothetical protein